MTMSGPYEMESRSTLDAFFADSLVHDTLELSLSRRYPFEWRILAHFRMTPEGMSMAQMIIAEVLKESRQREKDMVLIKAREWKYDLPRFLQANERGSSRET